MTNQSNKGHVIDISANFPGPHTPQLPLSPNVSTLYAVAGATQPTTYPVWIDTSRRMLQARYEYGRGHLRTSQLTAMVS